MALSPEEQAELDALNGGGALSQQEQAELQLLNESSPENAPLKAPPQAAPPKDPITTGADEGGTFFHNAVDGLTFGQLPRLAALTSAMQSPDKGWDNFSRNYDNELEASRMTMDAMTEENPKSALAGQVLGALPQMALGAGVASSAAKGAVGLAKVVPASAAAAKFGAKTGLAQGLARSRADLSEGEVGQFVADGAVGAGTGMLAANPATAIPLGIGTYLGADEMGMTPGQKTQAEVGAYLSALGIAGKASSGAKIPFTNTKAGVAPMAGRMARQAEGEMIHGSAPEISPLTGDIRTKFPGLMAKDVKQAHASALKENRANPDRGYAAPGSQMLKDRIARIDSTAAEIQAPLDAQKEAELKALTRILGRGREEEGLNATLASDIEAAKASGQGTEAQHDQSNQEFYRQAQAGNVRDRVDPETNAVLDEIGEQVVDYTNRRAKKESPAAAKQRVIDEGTKTAQEKYSAALAKLSAQDAAGGDLSVGAGRSADPLHGYTRAEAAEKFAKSKAVFPTPDYIEAGGGQRAGPIVVDKPAWDKALDFDQFADPDAIMKNAGVGDPRLERPSPLNATYKEILADTDRHPTAGMGGLDPTTPEAKVARARHKAGITSQFIDAKLKPEANYAAPPPGYTGNREAQQGKVAPYVDLVNGGAHDPTKAPALSTFPGWPGALEADTRPGAVPRADLYKPEMQAKVDGVTKGNVLKTAAKTAVTNPTALGLMSASAAAAATGHVVPAAVGAAAGTVKALHGMMQSPLVRTKVWQAAEALFKGKPEWVKPIAETWRKGNAATQIQLLAQNPDFAEELLKAVEGAPKPSFNDFDWRVK